MVSEDIEVVTEVQKYQNTLCPLRLFSRLVGSLLANGDGSHCLVDSMFGPYFVTKSTLVVHLDCLCTFVSYQGYQLPHLQPYRYDFIYVKPQAIIALSRPIEMGQQVEIVKNKSSKVSYLYLLAMIVINLAFSCATLLVLIELFTTRSSWLSIFTCCLSSSASSRPV